MEERKNEKACCFFGHRDCVLNEEEKQKLYKLILDMTEKDNYTVFYFGGFGNFDNLCFQTVLEVKKFNKKIKTVYVCCDEKEYLRGKNDKYDDYVCFELSFFYWYTRIYYRNCAIIDKSDCAVFYLRKEENSGAYKSYKYALSKNKTIYMI